MHVMGMDVQNIHLGLLSFIALFGESINLVTIAGNQVEWTRQWFRQKRWDFIGRVSTAVSFTSDDSNRPTVLLEH